jgi:CheY-like chemotaxis protein
MQIETSENTADNALIKFPNYDIILVDDNMPNLSGPMATKILRDRGYRGVIYGVTGNVNLEQINYFKANGANEVLAKPLKVELLKLLIERDLR